MGFIILMQPSRSLAKTKSHTHKAILNIIKDGTADDEEPSASESVRLQLNHVNFERLRCLMQFIYYYQRSKTSAAGILKKGLLTIFKRGEDDGVKHQR